MSRALIVVAVVCLALAGRTSLVNGEEDLGDKTIAESKEAVKNDAIADAAAQKEREAQEALGVAGMGDEPEQDEDTVSEPSYDAKMASRVKKGFSSWDTDSDGKLSKEELTTRLKEVAKQRQAREEAQIKVSANEVWGKLTKDMKADGDGDGLLSLAELSKVRDELSQKTRAAHGNTEQGGDVDDVNNLAMFTFMHLDWGNKEDGPKRLPNKDMFEISFNLADENQDGKLGSDEMRVLYDPFHFKRAEAVKAMSQAQLKLADVDGDGKLSFEEYKSILPPAPPPHKPEDDADSDEPEGESHEEMLKNNFEKYDKTTFDKEGIPKSDGKLDLDEFALLEYPEHNYAMDLESIFEHDKDNDGKMTVDELVENVVHFGHALHHEEL